MTMNHTALFTAFRALSPRPLSLPFLCLRSFSASAAPSASLQLTPQALSRLAALRGKARAEGRADADSLALRVRVDSGGCSGFRYEFVVESSGVQPGDSQFGSDGCYALVDEVSLGFLKGATLDWEESLMRSAFTIAANPNAEASCGCKMSFAAKA